MDPTWNWANYGQIHGQIQAQANYYAAATRQLRGAQSGSNSGQAINPSTAQTHHTNQNQMSSYPQNQMTSWFALHGHPHTHPGFNPGVHQANNHTDPTAFATNPFGIHAPQSAAHPTVPSYDAPGFLTGFQTAAAATAAAKANYLQPNHTNFKQLTAKDYEMNLRAAGFTHSHCGAMQASSHGTSMSHPEAPGMSAAAGAHLFPHLTPPTWRHHPNLMTTQHHGVNRTGPFGPLPHEETNLMQTRAGHHGSTTNMSAHANSSNSHSDKSCSVESNKQMQQNQKHNSSAGFFNQSVHSAGVRTSTTFDHYPSPKLAHHNQPQAEHHYLAMQAAAAAVGMSAASNQHVLGNTRTPAQCQYPSAMNFSGADILSMAVGSTSSIPKHTSNNQCHVRATNVAANNSYCNLMMGTVPNLNSYSQSHTHVNASLPGTVANHGNNSRSSSAASNHGLQGNDSSSGSYGYNSPSANHPHSPYQQRNTASVVSVTASSQATPVTAVPPNASNVQDFTNTNYINQGNAYTIGNPGASSARIDYPTPPSSAQIIPQAQPGSSQGQEDGLSHYSTSTQNANTYPSNSYSPYQAPKLSTSTSGPGSNNSVVSNTGSSSCMVEAAARAAAASNTSNGNGGYHHNALPAHANSLSDSDHDACLSNIVNVTPISDGMADIGKLNDSQMNSTLSDVLSGQGIDFQSINYTSGVEQAVNFAPALRLDGQNPAATVKKKTKVKKHKKKDKPKNAERISMNANNALSYSLPMHYNYNESFSSETCNSYQNTLHQTPTTEQHMHSQAAMLPMADVTEASQCFDPTTLNMQTSLIDESISHINSQQQASQTHSQTTQAHQQNTPQPIEFEKSQSGGQSQTLVTHHHAEESDQVLTSNEHLVNEKDLISDLEDDLSFLTEAATECEPPSSNDIGTQAGTQLITETVTNNGIETSSVSTSTECLPSETCSATNVLSTVVNTNDVESGCVLAASNTNGNIMSDKQSPPSGFQQNLLKFLQSAESTGKTCDDISENENTAIEPIEAANGNAKKRKHKEGKESKQKSVATLNGVKVPKTTKKNSKCNNLDANSETQRTSQLILNDLASVADGVKLTDYGKKVIDKEHEAKFFKARPSLNASCVAVGTNSNIGAPLMSTTKPEKNSKKRRIEEQPPKNPADEYEFPDSPIAPTTKKAKKNSSTENPSAKKKAGGEKSSNGGTTGKKSAAGNSKNKANSNSNQSSLLLKTPNGTNCDNLDGDVNAGKSDLNGILSKSEENQFRPVDAPQMTQLSEAPDYNNVVKHKNCQKPSQSQPQPKPQPQLQQQPPPPPPQQQQQQQQQQHQPQQHSQPVQQHQVLQPTKKTGNESKKTSNSGTTGTQNTSKTTQSVSMQSAGTNTPRRRSQDKKALTIREGLMRTGDFVVSLEEINCDLPMIWRIEGKSLLQRFEPSEQDNIIVYTNTSSYSAWNPTVRQRYTGVDVRIMGCSRTKIVVEKLGLTKTNPNNVNGDGPVVERCKAANSGCTFQHQENFEVFIQTLISQALDPNFIAEIVKENDEYFLSHVQAIDEYCGRKKSRFFSKVKWDAHVVKCVETFPTFTIIPQHNVGDLRCRLCHDNWSTQILNFSGQPYDQMTLELKDPVDIKQTKYAACDQCKERITLFSCLHHQKYNFFMKCKEKVDEMRAGDENKESHIILEQCLQDTEWIQSLFKQLEKIWCDCDDLR